MRITAAQTEEITPLVRTAVQLQIECWFYQSEIERRLGIYFKNMEQAVKDLAAAGDPEKIGYLDMMMFAPSLQA